MYNKNIYSLSEMAVTIEFSKEIDIITNEKVISAFELINKKGFPGYREAVPAYSSLTIYYNPVEIKRLRPYLDRSVAAVVIERLTEILSDLPTRDVTLQNIVSIPVCYEEEYAPDIAGVAAYCGLNIQQVISLHTNCIYRVFFTGFVPGFPYMGFEFYE